MIETSKENFICKFFNNIEGFKVSKALERLWYIAKGVFPLSKSESIRSEVPKLLTLWNETDGSHIGFHITTCFC